MNQIDEILGTTNKSSYSTNKKHNNHPQRNNWKEEQNSIRQKIYDTMDRMAVIVSNDTTKFRQYLDVQSRFSKYSTGNCLVILEKAPNSTHIKDEQAWNDKGIELLSNAKSIEIFELKETEKGRYYNPKSVYDISQTNAPKEEFVKNYNTRKLLEAIIENCDVPTLAVDKLQNGDIGCEYNKSENVLYICRNMHKDLLFQTLFQEIGNIEMKNEKESNIKAFRSYCISYLMCQKYGIDVSSFEFNALPNEITSQDEPKKIRGELNKIRTCFEKIDEKIVNHLQQNKEKKKSVLER